MRVLASMRIRLTGVHVFKRDPLIKYLGICGRCLPPYAPLIPFQIRSIVFREMLRESALYKEVNSHQLRVNCPLWKLQVERSGTNWSLVTSPLMYLLERPLCE